MSVRDTIHQKLTEAFTPEYVAVEDESHNHSVLEGAESHFKVVMASGAFADMRAVKRHQAVYAVLQDELAGSVHALALHLYTPDEWRERSAAPSSPNCMGGSKAEG